MRVHSCVSLITNSSSTVFVFIGDQQQLIERFEEALQEWANRVIDGTWVGTDFSQTAIVKAEAVGVLYSKSFAKNFIEFGHPTSQRFTDDWINPEPIPGVIEVDVSNHYDELPRGFYDFFRDNYGEFGFDYVGRED